MEITRLEMKNCNTLSIEKLKEYQYYYQVKCINMNILQVKKCYLLKSNDRAS